MNKRRRFKAKRNRMNRDYFRSVRLFALRWDAERHSEANDYIVNAFARATLARSQ
jgi:hypothetical protein